MARRGTLAPYKAKRDFGRTPEPRGGKARKGRKPIFVIQKHDATALHYDLRLEVDGVLKSWAVPRGPSMDPSVKRLAMPTEDHPMDYADFEGVIPQGEYGAGPMIVWDRGTYVPLEEAGMSEGIEKGSLKFWLWGKKIQGSFALVRIKPRDKRPTWLLIKHQDLAADASYDPVASRPESVISGRTIEAIGARPRRVTRRRRS